MGTVPFGRPSAPVEFDDDDTDDEGGGWGSPLSDVQEQSQTPDSESERQQPRSSTGPKDWQCFSCKNVNFAKRTVCNRCSKPRTGREREGDPWQLRQDDDGGFGSSKKKTLSSKAKKSLDRHGAEMLRKKKIVRRKLLKRRYDEEDKFFRISDMLIKCHDKDLRKALSRVGIHFCVMCLSIRSPLAHPCFPCSGPSTGSSR
jgi:hypothetical protein